MLVLMLVLMILGLLIVFSWVLTVINKLDKDLILQL